MNELFICLFSKAIVMKHNLVIYNKNITGKMYNNLSHILNDQVTEVAKICQIMHAFSKSTRNNVIF